MTGDQWEEIEDQLAETFGVGPFQAFTEAAGVILKRDLVARGLGGADPAALDADFAGRMLISAWTEAAVQCFPDHDPAMIVEHLALVVDAQRVGELTPAECPRH